MRWRRASDSGEICACRAVAVVRHEHAAMSARISVRKRRRVLLLRAEKSGADAKPLRFITSSPHVCGLSAAVLRKFLLVRFNSLFREMAFFDLATIQGLNGAGVIWIQSLKGTDLRWRQLDGRLQHVPFDVLSAGRDGERTVKDIVILIGGQKIGG